MRSYVELASLYSILLSALPFIVLQIPSCKYTKVEKRSNNNLFPRKTDIIDINDACMSVTSKIHIYIIREMTGKSHTGGVIFLISFYPPVRIVRIDGVLLLLSSLYSANLPVVDRVENLPVIKQHEIFICWLKEFNYFMHISVINDWQSLDKYSELWNCLHQKKKLSYISFLP